MYEYTTTTVTYSLSSYCEANISINRNRLKTYNSNVYLKDKQEFEIELFNPTQTTKLAKISINGKPISRAGIVLKPGQRVFLERYLDTPKKFLFETYEVEDSKAAKKAIENNGDIQIDFYDEFVPDYNPNITYTYNSNWDDYLNVKYRKSPTVQEEPFNLFNTCSAGSTLTGQSFMKSSAGASGASASIETGRVEQGSSSNQKFKNFSGQFHTYPSQTVNIKILPFSQKPLEVKDLATYCTSCGTKNKKGTYKYCPKCGTKF